MADVSAIVSSIDVALDFDGLYHSHIELDVIGPMVWMDGGSFQRDLTTRRTAKEYACPWCGTPNPITNVHCSQCGGQRDFLLGE